jgi:hypothetical protein
MNRILRTAAATAAALAVSAAAVFYGFTQHVLIRNESVAAAGFNPLSSEALSEAAVSALIAGDEARAEALARSAIRSSPITPLAFSTLGFVRQRQKRDREVADLMTAAARLSWADEAAQLWMISRAVDENKLEEAVARSDALLRQRRNRDALFTFLRGLSSEPAALDSIAARLATRPRWRQDFLTQLAGLGPDDYAGHEQLLSRLKRSAAPPTDDEVGAYLSRLVREHRYSEARAAWTRLGGRGAADGLISDGRFERLAGTDRSSPFGWTIHRIPGLSIGGDGGEGLRIAAEGRPSGLALEQVLVLAPGTYLLTTEAREASKGSLASLRWELTCLGGNGRPQIALRAPPQPERGLERTEGVVTIPPVACPAQRLELRIDHDEARDLDLSVRRVAMQPLN